MEKFAETNRKDAKAKSVPSRDIGAGGLWVLQHPQLETWGAEHPQLYAWNEICAKGYWKICRHFSPKQQQQGCVLDLGDQYCVYSKFAYPHTPVGNAHASKHQS